MTAMIGILCFEPAARGQDAAWEGFIKAGRDALQQENYAEAEGHFEDALEAAERFPSNDPRLGKSYNNLAAVYYAQEDYARAEPLMRRALTQLQEALGQDNTEVAQTMKNLAALYYLQGDRQEAESLLKQSLATMETVHGPNHAYVATVLSNLAGLYQAENRYEDAEPLLIRSLGIWESLLGADHPDVERSRELLAQVQSAYAAQRADARPREDETTTADAALTPAAGEAAADTAGTSATGPETGGQEDADVEPRALTPLAAATVEERALRAKEEAAQAAQALERLTRASRAEIEGARAAGLPAPSLRAIGEDGEGEGGAALAAAPENAGAADGGGEPGPGGDNIVAAALAAPGELEPNAAPADPAAATDGVTYAVYLSTLWSEDEARRYWQALRDAVPDILAEKVMEIEEVAADDGTASFYRVLTSPFASDPQATEACRQIMDKLRTHDCSVVVRGSEQGEG